jgi:anti-sigma B factor antagonist
MQTDVRGDVAVVTLDGRLDSRTAPAVQEDLGELVLRHPLVLLDLTPLSYMSSAGLRVLLLAYRQAQRLGAHLVLVADPGPVREVMRATGFLDFFTVTDTVTDGLEALTG